MKHLKLALVTLAILVACLGTAQETRAKIGKLAKITTEAPIFIKPDSRSRVLYRGKVDQYVVLRNIDEKWATVIMADGSNGYIETRFVERLPYDVNVKQPTTPVVPPSQGATLGTRGGSQPINRAGEWRLDVVRDALQFQGTRYVWGGNSLTRGVDCSGFIQQLFLRQGVKLPRTATLQSYVGEKVTRLEDMQPGDRLYFTDSKRQRITHTGLYIGNGYMIHSSSSKGGIVIEFLSQRWINKMVDVVR